MNEFCGAFSHNVHAENFLRFQVKQHFQHAALQAHNVAA